jgi:hypothetical protein
VSRRIDWFMPPGGPEDHRPVAPEPEPESVWLGPHGLSWFDGRALWLRTRHRVARVAAVDPTIVAGPDHLLVTDAESVLVVGDDHVDSWPVRPGVVRGVDTVGTWSALRWRVPGVPLPEGARRTRRLRPWPVGRGAVWADEGWLYRIGDRIDVLGEIGDDEVFFVGPAGAVLVGRVEDGVVWHSGAAPRRALQAFEAELDDVETRWSPDGRHVAVAADDGEAEGTARLDLRSGRVTGLRPRCLPASGDEGWDPVDARRVPLP